MLLLDFNSFFPLVSEKLSCNLDCSGFRRRAIVKIIRHGQHENTNWLASTFPRLVLLIRLSLCGVRVARRREMWPPSHVYERRHLFTSERDEKISWERNMLIRISRGSNSQQQPSLSVQQSSNTHCMNEISFKTPNAGESNRSTREKRKKKTFATSIGFEIIFPFDIKLQRLKWYSMEISPSVWCTGRRLNFSHSQVVKTFKK